MLSGCGFGTRFGMGGIMLVCIRVLGEVILGVCCMVLFLILFLDISVQVTKEVEITTPL